MVTLEKIDTLDKQLISILGTEWTIEIHEDDEESKRLKDMDAIGCNYCEKKTITLDRSEIGSSEALRSVLRHEILHSYLYESGLDSNSFSLNDDVAWALNEEMVDWFAIQSPKIFKTYKEVGAL